MSVCWDGEIDAVGGKFVVAVWTVVAMSVVPVAVS